VRGSMVFGSICLGPPWKPRQESENYWVFK
jgi:hypothetical protein